MNSARVLYHVVRADFLERIRRYSFLVTLAISVFLGYSAYTGQLRLQLEDYVGVVDSAWLGSLFALVISVWISLIGFYVVKNAIERDRQTCVGQILAATPMSKGLYTLGKALSNFAVLALMALVLAVAALLMALFAPGSRLDFAALLLPIVMFGLTALTVTAALAVLFESLPVLRGGVGNILYFFLWILLIIFGVMALPADKPGIDSHPMGDYTGIGIVMSQMQAEVHHLDPGYKGGSSFNVGDLNPATKTFVWRGVGWDAPILLGRLMWLAIAVALALLAAVFFDRFDVSRAGSRSRREPKSAAAQVIEEPAVAVVQAQRHTIPRLTADVPLSGPRSRWIALAVVELRIALKGRRWWWYAVAVGLIGGCLFSPMEISRGVLLPFAWFWPVLVWSQMGSREAQWRTGALVFSARHAAPRQLAATYLAGVAVAVLAGSGTLIRLLMAGDGAGLGTWCSAVLFIPAFALALGVTTGGGKTFEALYTAWWYIGPMHHIRGIDFMGTSAASSTPVVYLAAAMALGGVAYSWRRARLAYA